jgi:hypothetical protein
MAHYKSELLAEKGFAVLRPFDKAVPPEEYVGLEYMDWASGGDTNFAPIASALGQMECHGFWEHGKPDKDGIWTPNASKCPTLVEWTERVGARYGRVRTILLRPNQESEAIHNLHPDDNNRLNPDGEGWVVRAWLQLTDNPDSYMIVRESKDDVASEQRIPLPAGAQFIVDSERLYHAVWHPGPEDRYALIVSYESSPALDEWIRAESPVSGSAPGGSRAR